MKETITAERAVYYKLFLQNGLTERFDQELDERLERENPLSDLTLALSTCGGKREEQIHILNEYIRNTAPEQIDKDAVFFFVADELRERYEQNPDTDLKAFTMLMHDIARDSDWGRDFEPWATMYLMNDFYDEAYKDHIISKACFDYHSSFASVPDGYITNGKELQESFLSWMEDQPENIVITKDERAAVGYSDEDIIKYLNSVLLCDSKEKAYLITKEKVRKPIKFSISF